MPRMFWEDSFELGIKEFDDHHKRLIELLNQTYDVVMNEADNESIGVVLDALVDYATYHFIAEEYWMGLHGYPGLPQHREEHAMFSKRVVKIKNDFYNGHDSLSLEVLQFLQNWLSIHILKSDADYGRFAKGLPHKFD